MRLGTEVTGDVDFNLKQKHDWSENDQITFLNQFYGFWLENFETKKRIPTSETSELPKYPGYGADLFVHR